MDDLPSQKMVHEVLYYALLDIHDEARMKRDSVPFHLADTLHNVPLQLESAANGQCTYDSVFDDIKQRFAERRCDGWLNNVIATIERSRRASRNE